MAWLGNGADVVGLAVAEQPDVVLVEDSLEMLRAEEVVRALQQFCPQTLVVAQAGTAADVDGLRAAGAAAVLTAGVPAADVAGTLLELVGAA